MGASLGVCILDDGEAIHGSRHRETIPRLFGRRPKHHGGLDGVD